ncbi:MAG: magnesium/cobalt transporter CorA [Spirosomaceae bacterium]|nr:magnesium/cobalt transporter CorA [Spirosomataceae bacterium]
MAKKNRFKSPQQQVFSKPGSLLYIGKEVVERTVINRFQYDAEGVTEKVIKKVENCFLQPTPEKVIWLDIDGVHEERIVEMIGQQFNLHPLLLEDVLNTTQKAKIEQFEEANLLFVVAKMLHFNAETLDVDTEQVSLILGENFLISFQEQDKTDNFTSIHERLRNPMSRIRQRKADYLLYALLDVIVDNYYVVLERITQHLEELEESVLNDPTPKHQNQLYALKREMTFMRKAVLPLRDVLGALIREDSVLVGNQVNVYLRDVQDHVFQTIETLDTYRDIADNIMNTYLSSLSNKMNEVMKTLTIYTAIFMPLSFIAGLYGMNFANMPELQSPNGYFYTLGGMGVIVIGLWIYFKWKKYW